MTANGRPLHPTRSHAPASAPVPAPAPARAAEHDSTRPTLRLRVPLRGATNPGRGAATTPGSFANAPDLGGPLMYSSPDSPGMPAPSTKTAWHFLPAGCRVEAAPDHQRGCLGHGLAEFAGRPVRVAAGGRETLAAITQLEQARLGIVTPQMRRVAEREPHLTPELVRDEIAAGRMVIPANVNHLAHRLDPMCIGRASRTKVNANMGASPIASGTESEIEKLDWAIRWGADTVMDLSTGGNLDECREAFVRHSTVPIGTVPIYSMIIGRTLEELTPEIVFESLRHQAQQGVDYFTIHAGVRRGHLKYVRNRLIGIVSRGGSLLAKWMLVHGKENLMYDRWDEICRILREHDVTFSIGDGLRPGGLADATDDAQLAELETIGELTERAWRHGVQVMVEGPGHVPFDQIEYNAKIQRALCHGAPFYVLGPLVTDIFPGYDHITSCIGATAMAYHGAAMLCYVTPKEHLGLPKRDDVKQGCIAYRIAAHAADIALGIPGERDRDDELTKARAALNWEKHFELSFDPDTARAYHDEDLDVDTDFCAMCGHDWCSVRISKEIQEFASGKADGFDAGKPKRSDALTPEQQEILAKRGVLSPDEIHRLAAKTRKAMDRAAVSEKKADPDADATPKLSCHSDFVDPAAAKRLQEEKLVQLNVGAAMNVSGDDRII